jgi:ribosomal protein S18 acetylase RimI-like enzyme
MGATRLYEARASDWPKLPLIYEADCYFMAAGGMRKRALKELREFEAGERLLFLADVDGRVAGTVGLVFRGMDRGQAKAPLEANVHRLHVVKQHRRCGVATALMAAAEGAASQRQIERLLLEVEPDNGRARSLYEKLGYRYVRRPGSDSNLVMAKPLAQY